MGFSAGGHLASTAGTHFDAGTPEAADPLDRLSCRPDFLVLIYPVISMQNPIAHQGSRKNLLGANPDPKLLELYSNELQVTAQTPPAFLVQTRDDGVKVENSIRFDEAMKKAGVPSELNLFDKGGHGYGLGINGGEVATWPQRFEKWLESKGLLKP
jgi:acetyl esterase/lipase